MHNHHYNHSHHREPPHRPPPSNPPSRLEPNKHHSSSHELSPPPQPDTPGRVQDLEPELVGGAMIVSEKYYSPMMSPSESYMSPSSTMHMHMHVRDDFPPPKLSSLQSHHFLSFKENQESPDDHHHHPSPPTNTVNQQHVRGLSWREGSPLSMPPRPPGAPPRMGIVYGGASDGGGGGGGGVGGERNKRKEGVEQVKIDVESNTNMNTNMNTNTNTDRGLFKVNKTKMGWLKKFGMALRILELVFCVVSFSVMGSDKTQGWSGDSFDRYKEYRFCFTVNILGFAYAGVQVLKLGLYLVGGNQCIISHHLCCKFDFFMDQITAYLLVAASTAAATRVADWEANWGKDAFTEKASMSVTMAFLAFIAFSCNSLISGYNIFSS